MPYRNTALQYASSTIVEGITLASVTIYQAAALLAQATPAALDWWDRITGRNGALFAVTIGLIAVWAREVKSSKERAIMDAKREEKEDALRKHEADERERRHVDILTIQKESAATSAALAAEAIKARLESSIAQKDMAREFSALAKVIMESPCLATGALRAARHIQEMDQPQQTL